MIASAVIIPTNTAPCLSFTSIISGHGHCNSRFGVNAGAGTRAGASASADASDSIVDDKTALLRAQIVRIRSEREFEQKRHEKEVEQATKSRQEVLERKWKDIWRKFMERFPYRHYTSYIKTKQMPSYLLIQQAKLLRKVHHLCILDNQAALLQTQSNHLIKAIKKKGQQISEEKSRLEMNLLTTMMQLQQQETEMRDSFHTIISNQSQQLDQLKLSQSSFNDIIDPIHAAKEKQKPSAELDTLVKQIRKVNWWTQSRNEGHLGLGEGRGLEGKGHLSSPSKSATTTKKMTSKISFDDENDDHGARRYQSRKRLSSSSSSSSMGMTTVIETTTSNPAILTNTSGIVVGRTHTARTLSDLLHIGGGDGVGTDGTYGCDDDSSSDDTRSISSTKSSLLNFSNILFTRRKQHQQQQ